MASLNKKQVKLLFDREAVLLGTADRVPLTRAVALFGEDAVNHAQHFEAGVYTNGYGVGDYTLPCLTIQGFQAAASFYNAQQVRGETRVIRIEDDAAAMQELLARAKAQNPSFATMTDQDLITLLIEKGFKKAGDWKMNRNIALADDLLSGITQTDTWKDAQLENPEILAADKVLAEALGKLRGIAPERVINQIVDAAYAYASAFETAAILYGIHVADTLRDCSAHSEEVSQFILDRMASSRGKA